MLKMMEKSPKKAKNPLKMAKFEAKMKRIWWVFTYKVL